jgi:CPA2 family monovalent cation:H+ antiporter-2
MTVFALLLMAAAVGHALARRLSVPVIPLFLAMGMLLSGTGLLPGGIHFHLEGDPDSDSSGASPGAAARVLELGLVFLVFASGIELNPRRYARQRNAVLWVALIQFTVATVIGYALARLMAFDPLSSTYLGVGVAASSTLVALFHLRTRRAMFEPFGRVVSGVLLLQDLAVILLLVTLSRLSNGAPGILIGLIEAAGLGGAAYLCQRKAIPWLLEKFKPDEEALLLWIVSFLFLFLGVASAFKLPLVVGAFFAGFSFSAFPVHGIVRGLLKSISDFFLALFFIALGAVVGFPEGRLWLDALQFAVLVVFITPPLVTAIAEYRGMNTRAAIETGLLLAQTSEYSLILGLSGVFLGHIHSDIFSILALTTVMTMTLTPFIGTERFARWLILLHPQRRRHRISNPPKDHVLMLGFGSAGMWIVRPLLAAGHSVLVVDDDAVVIQKLTEIGVPCLRGDGAEEKVLEQVGARQAKVVLASMRRLGDAIEVLEHVQGVPVLVRVFETEEAQQVERFGGIPILGADAAAVNFLAWFDSRDDTHVRDPESVKNLG